MNEPNRTEWEIRCAFNSFCKKAIKCEASNAHRDVRRHQLREVTLALSMPFGYTWPTNPKGGHEEMASDSKYLNFAVEAAEHKKLKLLCFYRGCTLKSILLEMVHDYVENAPEFKKEEQ